MSDQRSFLALVHHTGKIKRNSRVGIRFSSKEPLVDIVASSDGSNQHPPSIHIGGSSSLSPPAEPAIPVIPPLVASPSFAADLHPDDDDECDLDDNRTFGKLVTAIASNPRSPQIGVQISEPEGVEEALREDEEEEEPELIADDSDEDD
ncbi:hypothetical protein PIB30_073299 [Stylosanthes scabra]|uniref:Uncharacterized protein n=1 Tax=Stylosanthes scabra TaxID=79078 RepID=A0ABU6XMV5_9FABA|nr:hypothetical protein [Stylosanthes scabra]